MSNTVEYSKTILLSIKPQYAEKILSGEKRYEFRLTVPKVQVKTVYMYATAPERQIVGMFEVHRLFRQWNLRELWAITFKHAGISFETFAVYFSGWKSANAYEIVNPVRFAVPIDPWYLFGEEWRSPQNFKYLSDSDVDCITAAVKVSMAKE